jgi:hypothetical protein
MTIFPDTNSFLHYPSFKDVDWPKVARASDVKIVLCMQVIHELDEKKNDPRLTGRAERIIKEIRAILSAGQPLRPGVNLSVFNHELRATDFPDSLSPDSKDDRIVHLVKRYVEITGETNVAVYTEDLGMMLRCQGHGVAVIEPDKAARLDSPVSEQEKKYKAAITELNQLKNRQPKIDVALYDDEADGDGPLRVVLQKLQPINIEAAVEQERKAIRVPRLPGYLGGIGGAALLSMVGPTEDDWKKYEERCESYLTEFREWVKQDAAATAASGLHFSFSVSVSNNGSAVGEDVDVYMTFPPVIKFIIGDGNDQWGNKHYRPTRPERPRKPEIRDRMAVLKDDLGRRELFDPFQNLRVPQVSPPGAPWSDFDGTIEDGLRLRLFIPKLRHHTSTNFGPFSSGILDWDNAKPFEIQLTVLAANLPHAAESKVPVIVQVKE